MTKEYDIARTAQGLDIDAASARIYTLTDLVDEAACHMEIIADSLGHNDQQDAAVWMQKYRALKS